MVLAFTFMDPSGVMHKGLNRFNCRTPECSVFVVCNALLLLAVIAGGGVGVRAFLCDVDWSVSSGSCFTVGRGLLAAGKAVAAGISIEGRS